MKTGSTRFEEMDFKPRLPLFRLTGSLLAFGFLTFAFVSDTRTRLEFRSIAELGFLAEIIFVGLTLLCFIGFMLSNLLLQYRLRFTEEGFHRRTLFKPRFIAWKDVQRARLGAVTIRGGTLLMLELYVSRWRWVWVPLLEYRRSASLLAEIRKRLPVNLEISGRAEELLRDESN